MIKITSGEDAGNGTRISVAGICNEVYTSFNAGYMATGEVIKSISAQNITGDEAQRLGKLKEVNGETDVMIVRYAPTDRDYYVGVSTSLIASGLSPINPSGIGKYGDKIYMRVMLQAAYQGLMNSGMSVHFGTDKEAELHLCFGLAPEFYFDEVVKNKVQADLDKVLINYNFEYMGVTFTVKSIMVRPESIAAFFSYIIDVDYQLDKILKEKRYLIIDGGHTTFDTLIVANMKRHGIPKSNPKLGIGKVIFTEVANKAKQYGMDITAMDVENHNYGADVTKITNKELVTALIDGCKDDYLSRARSEVHDTYESRHGEFDQILVTGGVAEIFSNEVIKDNFSIAGKDTHSLDVSDNASGLNKLCYINRG